MSLVPENESSPQAPPDEASGVRLAVPTAPAVGTYILLGLIVAIWLAMTALGGSEDPYVLLAFGAKYNPLIAAGQYWRLLTATFLHIGILHLLFNGYSLYILGSMVESRFGHSRFVILYLLAGVAGSTASFLGNKALSAGAHRRAHRRAAAGPGLLPALRGRMGAGTRPAAPGGPLFAAAGRPCCPGTECGHRGPGDAGRPHPELRPGREAPGGLC
jgi:hypothetical protein